jgi:hypothetical protein
LLERLAPPARDRHWHVLTDAGVLLLCSACSMFLFRLFREPRTIVLVLAAAALLFVAALRFSRVCLIVLLPFACAVVCDDVQVLLHFLPSVCLTVLAFLVCRDFCFAFSTIPVSVDDLITIQRPFWSPCRSMLWLVIALGGATWQLRNLAPHDRALAVALGYRAVRGALFVVAFVYWLLPPRRKLRTCLRALAHWLDYNSQNSTHPGVYQSPAGSVPVRILLTSLVCILLAAIEAWPPWTRSDPAIPPEFHHVLVRFPIGSLSLPLVTILAGCLLAGRTRLLRAARIHEDSADNEWAAITEREALYHGGIQ